MKNKASLLSSLAIMSIMVFSACTGQEEKPSPQSSDDKVIEDIDLVYDMKASPVLFDITSTGCPGCGGWGKPTFASLVEEFEGEITPLAIHIKYGDPFITPWSQSIADNRYGSRYTPQIWVNDTNGVVLNGGIDNSASLARIRSLIENARDQDLPMLSGAILDRSENSMHVKVGIKSETPLDGEYSLACYLVKDELVHDQSNYDNNPAKHDFVIRKAFSGGVWGTPVQLENGVMEMTEAFTSIETSQTHHVVLLLWKKSGNRYTAIGGKNIGRM